MNVALTAGGRISGAYAEAAGTTIKALAPVGDATMLAKAIAAARGTGAERIAVVGGEEVERACRRDVDRVVGESEDGRENLLRGLTAWPEDEPLLLMTTDLPFVTASALRAFLDLAPDAAFAMPLATPAAFDERFPGAPAYGIALAGERVVNGGAFRFPAGCAGRIAGVAAAFFAARKSPFAMAALLGPALAIRFLTNRLSIAALEADAARRFGVAARAVRGCAPELCFDADAVEEYRYALARA